MFNIKLIEQIDRIKEARKRKSEVEIICSVLLMIISLSNVLAIKYNLPSGSRHKKDITKGNISQHLAK